MTLVIHSQELCEIQSSDKQMMPTCSDLKDVQGFDVCHIQGRKNIVSVTFGIGVIVKNTQLVRKRET